MINTLTDALYFVKAQLKEVGETSIDDMLVLEYLRQSVGMHQDMFVHYLKDVTYKEVAGAGTIIPVPSDLKSSLASEIVMQVGKGVVFTYNLVINAGFPSNPIVFTALEPKEQTWEFILSDGAMAGREAVIVNLSAKTITINYASFDTDSQTIAGTIVTLLNADPLFRQEFAPATTPNPNRLMLATGTTEQTLGSGNGFYEATYLPFEERKSVIHNHILEPKENIQMYFCLHEALSSASLKIEILPNTMTHYKMTYPISLIPTTSSDTLKIPAELMPCITSYTVLKLIQRNLSASMAETEQKLYLSAYKIQLSTYENQLRQAQDSYALNNPKLKTA